MGSFFAVRPGHFLHLARHAPEVSRDATNHRQTVDQPGASAFRLGIARARGGAIFADNLVGYPYNGELNWNSSDPSIATVDENGLLVTEDVDGDTAVTITVELEGVSGTLTVNVRDTTLVGGVIISDNDSDLIHDGDYTIAVENTEKWRCLFLDESGAHLYNLTRDTLWISDSVAVSVPDIDAMQGSSADVSRSTPGPALIRCGIERDGYSVETHTVVQ